MISEVIYMLCKAYFMFMPFFYIYALLTGQTDLFLHVSGLVGIAFLLSNVKWYLFGGGNE